MEILERLWPFLLLQLILVVAAIVDIVRQKKTKNLSPLIWVVIILFLNILGPVLYFTVGRNDE